MQKGCFNIHLELFQIQVVMMLLYEMYGEFSVTGVKE